MALRGELKKVLKEEEKATIEVLKESAFDGKNSEIIKRLMEEGGERRS